MKKSNHSKGLWVTLAPVRGEMLLSVLLAAVGTVALIASLTVLSFTVAHLLLGEPITLLGVEIDLLKTIILLAAITLVAFSSRLASFLVSHLASFKLEQILRTRLSQHLAEVPLGYVTAKGSGALKKVMQSDVKGLHAFVADSVPMIVKGIIAPLMTLLILFWADYRLAAASVSLLLLGALLLGLTMRDFEYYRVRYEQSQGEINKAVIEFAQAMPVVRTFDDGSQSFRRYHDSLAAYRQNLLDWMAQTSTADKAGMVILSPLPTLIVVIVVGLYLHSQGTLDFSAFLLTLFLSTGMADALMPVMWLLSYVKKSQASAIRIFDILDVDALPQVAHGTPPKDSSVIFDQVCFRYDGAAQNALSDVSFSVSPGTVTALVGPSGAGKSTIAKLIPRFWDVDAGAISIGDVDIRDMTSEQLMNSVSFVFQDTFLFHDSILNNIRLADPEAGKEQVIAAAKAAQIHDFIETLPSGYETKAGDRGANLSGGQKQRITIARAILRNNPILVLDEATAFADPENEAEIIKALANLMKAKTVIVIAHRLSTIRDVDQILVIDHGEVFERGQHQELLDNRNVYFKLWQNGQKAETWHLESRKAAQEIF